MSDYRTEHISLEQLENFLLHEKFLLDEIRFVYLLGAKNLFDIKQLVLTEKDILEMILKIDGKDVYSITLEGILDRTTAPKIPKHFVYISYYVNYQLVIRSKLKIPRGRALNLFFENYLRKSYARGRKEFYLLEWDLFSVTTTLKTTLDEEHISSYFFKLNFSEDDYNHPYFPECPPPECPPPECDCPEFEETWEYQRKLENENCYPMVAPGRSNSQMLGLEKKV